MLDIKFIRENKDIIEEALRKRKYSFDLEEFLSLDKQRRVLIAEIDNLRNKQKTLTRQISELFREKKDTSLKAQALSDEKISQSKTISSQIEKKEKELSTIKEKFNFFLLRLPNIPHTSLPQGGEENNIVIKEGGKKKDFSYPPRKHMELITTLKLVDLKRGAKIAASHFPLFEGKGAKLVRALINFMLDIHTKNGYKEIWPPSLVNRTSMTTTGQLPNLEEDMYCIEKDDLFLIPTAEVPLTNLFRDEVFSEEELPFYCTAYTPCFRREAGSYGRETRGLVRLHQFDKVELVKFVHPDNSYQELEKLLEDALRIIKLLELPYRVVMLSTEEISFASSKCYDIEVYAPGLDKYLEVSSCSNFESFQARRGNIRYRNSKTKKLDFVHTLNASGVALPRLIIALLENYQTENGEVIIPERLLSYFGEEKITLK